MIIYKLDINNFPTDCFHCPLCEYDNYCIALKNYLKENDISYERNKDCPLIDVKDVIPYIRDKSNELQINDIWDGSGD